MTTMTTDNTQKTDREDERGAHSRPSSSRKAKRQGGKFIPALCNVIGTLLLLGVIAISLPLGLPHFLGYEAYNVVTGSMEPTIPVGSVIYVEPAAADTAQQGDIIAFYKNGDVVTHRVVENHYFYDEIITKGDANETNDIEPVEYRNFIGKVKWHFPIIGNLLAIYTNQVTKLYLLCLAACGVMFNILAGRMRVRQQEQFREKLERYDRRQTARMNEELEKLRGQQD